MPVAHFCPMKKQPPLRIGVYNGNTNRAFAIAGAINMKESPSRLCKTNVGKKQTAGQQKQQCFNVLDLWSYGSIAALLSQFFFNHKASCILLEEFSTQLFFAGMPPSSQEAFTSLCVNHVLHWIRDHHIFFFPIVLLTGLALHVVLCTTLKFDECYLLCSNVVND